MGHFLPLETFTIRKDFGEPHGIWEVELKRHWTIGDDEHVTNNQLELQFGIQGDKPVPGGLSMRFGKIAVAERIIIGWNAEDEKGDRIAVSSEAIRMLDPKVFTWIIAEWQKETAPKEPSGGKTQKRSKKESI